MLEEQGKIYRRDAVVYLRMKVIGFDVDVMDREVCICQPVTKDGELIPDDPAVYYTTETSLIDGNTTVKEVQEHRGWRGL